MTTTALTALTAKHNGQIVAANDAGTQFRIKFPVSTRAAAFFDHAAGALGTTRGLDTPTSCTVVVTL